MSLDNAMERLREANEPVPRPMRLPTQDEVTTLEQRLSVRFHPDYRKYLLEASDVVVGVIEPATITDPESHTHLPDVCARAWAAGVPKSLLPICEDNGDYYCLDARGRVVFYSHDGRGSASWPDLAAWIEQVWLEESD